MQFHFAVKKWQKKTVADTYYSTTGMLLKVIKKNKAGT
jgi:hypothetical protein